MRKAYFFENFNMLEILFSTFLKKMSKNEILIVNPFRISYFPESDETERPTYNFTKHHRFMHEFMPFLGGTGVLLDFPAVGYKQYCLYGAYFEA